MRQNKKRTDRVAVALVMCFCVVAIASVFTVKSGIDKLNNISTPGVDISHRQTETPEQDVVKRVPTVDSQTTKQNESTSPSAEQTPAYVNPVEGTILTAYSPDVPIYSNTLDQYMTHEGVDITADLDAQVKAIAPGTVTDVYTDDRYGITVVISHGNGLCSIYSNLSTTKMVEPGDVVTKGQVISGIGETALFEALDPSHLHFAMTKDGVYVDPLSYVGD